jgi:hypothetical protein
MSDYPHITYKRHTFLSALVMGLCAVTITIILSGTALIIYSIHFVGDKSENVIVPLVKDAMQGLPVLQKSLPPALADLMNDRRLPDYRSQLEIGAKTFVQEDRHGRMRTEITVTNKGQEVVTLLSLRLVIFDPQGDILDESNEWAATPIEADEDWRGPILPGSTRYFAVSHHGESSQSALDNLKTEIEVTDIRVWNGNKEIPAPSSDGSSPPLTSPSNHNPS